MDELNQAYRLGLAAVGADVIIRAGARIIGPENISIGDSVIIDDFAFVMCKPVSIGSFVHIAPGAALMGGSELVLGDFVGISGGTRVYTGDDDYLGGSLTGPTVPDRYRHATRSFVRIGRHAIIGAGCVVLPGVTIGEGAAIGAMSLINRDVEAWTLNRGIPCRPIRTRPRERILELEADLRRELYDPNACYIPKAQRSD